MKAATDTKLGGAKKRTSVAPDAQPKRAAAKKTETNGTAASEVEVTATRKVSEGEVMPQASAENEAVAALPDETSAPTLESDTDGAPKRKARKKASSAAVKALTEAGKKRLVNRLLALADLQATEGGFKITPADLIRLMQLHKELTPQKDRKVTVQWVEDRAA